jgi:GNAT superfamily N-acetyltransferase
MPETSEFTIRSATSADAPTIAWHRARMWQDMGEVPDDLFELLRTKSEAQLRQALADGAYVGWLASAAPVSNVIIAGAGVHLRNAMPHPLKTGNETVAVAEGRHGTIVNVFTEPEWRRRGVADLLMKRIIAWSREVRLDRLVLHASDAGRDLYEKLGFVATNEMRLE